MAKINGSWEDVGDRYEFMHIVVPGSRSDASSPENMAAFKEHLLLEFLAYLKIIEYSRGYDGIYYYIEIIKRGQ